MLLTWIRAGRHSKRCRSARSIPVPERKPKRRVLLRPQSKQGTPCQTPRAEDQLPEEEGAVHMPSLLSALQAHKDKEQKKAEASSDKARGKTSSDNEKAKSDRGEREGRRRSRPPTDGLFDELRGVQVRAMQSQGMRHQLRRSLPEELGRANTFNRKTPGFGQETPNFPLQAADSSRLASGQQTAAGEIAMSPWMFASSEDSAEPPVELLDVIDELGSFPDKTAFNVCLAPESLIEDPILDDDELAAASVPSLAGMEPQEGTIPLVAVRPEPVVPTCESKVGVYPVGECVSYFSKSRMGWMKGVVMEVTDGFYLVDKGFGCCGKCGWAELMNEADRKQHVYRLIDTLDGKPFRIRPSGQPVVRDDISSDDD